MRPLFSRYRPVFTPTKYPSYHPRLHLNVLLDYSKDLTSLLPNMQHEQKDIRARQEGTQHFDTEVFVGSYERNKNTEKGLDMITAVQGCKKVKSNLFLVVHGI